MITLTTQPVLNHSKKIDVSVHDNTGRMVACMRSTDLPEFLDRQEWLNNAPAVFVPSGVCESMLTVDVMVYWTSKYYETLTICYSPDGTDIAGNGRNLAVNLNSSMLTHAYIAPQPLKLIGADLLVETTHGTFQLVKDNRGYYTATKIN